jgi:hypothetical protein
LEPVKILETVLVDIPAYSLNDGEVSTVLYDQEKGRKKQKEK